MLTIIKSVQQALSERVSHSCSVSCAESTIW